MGSVVGGGVGGGGVGVGGGARALLLWSGGSNVTAV